MPANLPYLINPKFHFPLNQYKIKFALQSKLDNSFFVRYTIIIKKMLDEHNSGKVRSTSARRPFEVVYYEVYFNQKDALH